MAEVRKFAIDRLLRMAIEAAWKSEEGRSYLRKGDIRVELEEISKIFSWMDKYLCTLQKSECVKIPLGNISDPNSYMEFRFYCSSIDKRGNIKLYETIEIDKEDEVKCLSSQDDIYPVLVTWLKLVTNIPKIIREQIYLLYGKTNL